jgi:hypothetical protein
MLHDDYATGHTAISVNEVLTKKCTPVDLQPLYSSGLSPCDLFLFPKLKLHLKGRHLGIVDNTQMVVKEQLRELSHEDFQHFYREWEQLLRRCLASQRIFSSVVNKKFPATVALLFRHTFQRQNTTSLVNGFSNIIVIFFLTI